MSNPIHLWEWPFLVFGTAIMFTWLIRKGAALKFRWFGLVALFLSSCTAGPMIKENALVDQSTGKVIGTSTTILMGGTFAAKRKGVVSQAKKTGKGGWTVAYMTDSESSEGVPMAGMAAWASVAASSDAASVSRVKETTAQGAAVQETARHAKTVDGQVTLGTAAIGAGTPVTVAPIKTP